MSEYLTEDELENSVWHNNPRPKRPKNALVSKEYLLWSLFFEMPIHLFNDLLKPLKQEGLIDYENNLTQKGINQLLPIWSKRKRSRKKFRVFLECTCYNGIKNREEVLNNFGIKYKVCNYCNYSYTNVGG